MPAVEDPRSLGDLDLFQGMAPDQLTELNGLLRSQAVQAGAVLKGRNLAVSP